MYYFAYGSNLSKKQMQERCPESKGVFRATLPNHTLTFTGWSRRWRGGTATIKRVTGEKVLGAVYECSEKDLKRLDTYEVGYSRLNVIVFDEDGNPLQAITYIKTGQLEETRPSQEYVSIIQQGYKDWGII